MIWEDIMNNKEFDKGIYLWILIYRKVCLALQELTSFNGIEEAEVFMKD